MKKAKKRSERSWPQAHRILSLKFPDGFSAVDDQCFVPYSDCRKLETRYLKIFGRYKKARFSRNSRRDKLVKSLDDYIEFAEGCRNFSNLSFYKELQDYIKNP